MELLGQFANWKFYLFGAYPAGPMGGLSLNIILAVLSIIIGLFMGALLGLGRMSCRRYICYPCIAYIDGVRSTPLLMIVFWFYFFLPVIGIRLPLLWCAVIPLSIYAAAYQAEIVRAGVLAVPKGQMEAALSSGMSRLQAIMTVILPQAFKMMVPSFVSFFNSQFKNTSVVYIIGIVELTQTGIIISQRQPDRMLAAYICMAMGFWVVCYGLSYITQKLEKKLGILDSESYKPEICREDLALIPLPKAIKEIIITQK
jgi:polar amino acid transport system permease protein